MRGLPANPVPCVRCGDPNGFPASGLCLKCRLDPYRASRKKYHWTPEQELALRRAYQGAHTRKEVSLAIGELVRLTGFPRNHVSIRAHELRLTADTRRPWTAEENAYLREWAGRKSVKHMASKLQRTFWAVKCQLSHQQLSSRIVEGYTVSDLVRLLAVGAKTVERWEGHSWLRRRNGRFTEPEVAKFLTLHAEEYDLRRVDQPWFKGMIFPAFGGAHVWSEELRTAARGAKVTDQDTMAQT